MDPPESSGNRFGRTIWTVWGYLSGAVARYLRPEVTAEGNQSVRGQTHETGLRSAVNNTDREVKTNNSNDEDDRAEVKCSPSKVRAAASVPWENTDNTDNTDITDTTDNTDQLSAPNTKKQRYSAAWSTATEAGRERHTAERVSSDEEEHANRENEDRETTQEPEDTGETEPRDGDNKEECDENHELEECSEKREDAENTDVMIQSERDDEQDEQIDPGQTEEHLPDETQRQITVQKSQENTERDEDQGTELDLTDEANSVSDPERLTQTDKDSDEVDDVSKHQIEEMMLGDEQDEESQTSQESEEIVMFEQKDGDSEERQDREVEKCDIMREDQSNTDPVMIQSELDEEQDEQIDPGQTEEHLPDETQRQITVQKSQENTEREEDQGTELDLTDEANSVSDSERLKAMEKYSDEINEFSKNRVEEMKPGTEQDTTEREQDMSKYELMESESGEHTPDHETELKMIVVEDITTDALRDSLLLDSENNASENTPESGTGSPVPPTRTEDVLSDLTEFPGEPGRGREEDQIQATLHDPPTPAERDSETEHDTETLTQTHQTQRSLRGLEFRAEPTAETTEANVSSDDEEAEESQSLAVRNVSLQPRQLLEVTEGQCKASPETADASRETRGAAERDSEEQAEVEPVSERSLSPAELLEEPRDLQEKTALQDAEEITNHVLREIIETEGSSEQKTESQTTQESEEIVMFEQKDGDSEERDEDHEVEKCDIMREDQRNTDPVMIQSELDEEQDEQIDPRQTEEHLPDETQTQITVQKSQENTEREEDQGTELDLTDEANSVSDPERLTQTDKDSDEVNDVSKHQIEEMMLGDEQDTLVEHPSQCECDLEEERRLLAETMDSSEETEADGRHEPIAGETVLRRHEDRPALKRAFDRVSTEPKKERAFDLILQVFEDSSLDFSVQKCRIAVKNPLVRPPKDPRKLLFRASAEPFPLTSPRGQTPPRAVMGFKLPGLGAGLPVLRKTEFVEKAEAERTLQTQQKSETEDSFKQEQAPAKPKWTPPRHPGMGSPFMMAELKNKLRKPVQE